MKSSNAGYQSDAGKVSCRTLDELASSSDKVARELERTLKVYQNIKASRGQPRSIGYEPRDIREHGAIQVIERRSGIKEWLLAKIAMRRSF